MVYAHDAGNDGNGRDGNGNSDSYSDGNDAAAAAKGNGVNYDNSGDLRTAIGQQQFEDDDGITQCTLVMTAMKVMAKTATAMVTVTAMAMAMAMAMMLPPLPTATMSMKTTAVIQGQQLDNGKIGQ
jgi:hypothetical protein